MKEEELCDLPFSMRFVEYWKRVHGALRSADLSLLVTLPVDVAPQQRQNVGCVVFYSVRIVAKETRLLALPKTPRNVLLNEDLRVCGLVQKLSHFYGIRNLITMLK
jgi:hypothetical protein